MDASIDASPVALTHEGFAYAPQPLPDGRVVFSQTTMSSPSRVRILSPTDASSSLLQGSEISELASFAEDGLQNKMLVPVEEVWFSGAEGRKVHGFIILPPGYKKGQSKKWPALMMCHGGPQAAWNDQWSTRWNPQVWAGQGYM
jgi:dipeptidyl aminopeptidase/acylaminoacyl peptidase